MENQFDLAYQLLTASKLSKIEILEKEKKPGGLLRSYNINGIFYVEN